MTPDETMDVYNVTWEDVERIADEEGYHLFRRPGEYFIVHDDMLVGVLKDFEINPDGYTQAIEWMKNEEGEKAVDEVLAKKRTATLSIEGFQQAIDKLFPGKLYKATRYARLACALPLYYVNAQLLLDDENINLKRPVMAVVFIFQYYWENDILHYVPLESVGEEPEA